MKSKLIHLLALPTIYIFWQYVQVWIDMSIGEFRLKPFVYRALVPELVDVLMHTGLPKDISYILIISLSLIGYLFAMKSLSQKMYGESCAWGLAYISSWFLILLVWAYCKPYDLMTAFLMTLCYLLIWNQDHKNLLLVFPFVVLNRETSFLIVILSAVWFWRKMRLMYWMDMIIVQGAMFLSIQSLIRIHYATYVGQESHIQLSENLNMFSHNLVLTVSLITGFAIILGLLVMNWSNRPKFLRVAFLTLFPILFVLYLVFGYGYEVRVFAEIFPIVWLLLSKEQTNEAKIQIPATLSSTEKGYVQN